MTTGRAESQSGTGDESRPSEAGEHRPQEHQDSKPESQLDREQKQITEPNKTTTEVTD